MSQYSQQDRILEDFPSLDSFEKEIEKFEQYCQDTPADLYEALGGNVRVAPPSGGSAAPSSAGKRNHSKANGRAVLKGGGDSTESHPRSSK